MKEIVKDLIDYVEKSGKVSGEIKKIFKKAINNTFTTTMRETDRGDVFVITGDIDAMWLRDSSGLEDIFVNSFRTSQKQHILF